MKYIFHAGVSFYCKYFITSQAKKKIYRQKVGFEWLVQKYMKKKIPKFLNRYYLHLFKK